MPIVQCYRRRNDYVLLEELFFRMVAVREPYLVEGRHLSMRHKEGISL